MNAKKMLVGLILVGGVAGGVFMFGARGQNLGVEAKVEASEAVRDSDHVVAEAKVVPVRNVALSLPTGGIVAEVAASEGDVVAPGQVLLRLSGGRQAAAVARAEADLSRAEANLHQLKSGARVQEIQSAQAAVAAAEAKLAQVKETSKPEDIAAADAKLSAAQSKLKRTQEGATQDERTVRKADLKRAEVAVKQAQAEYDPVKYRNDIGALPQAAALEKATIEYERAKADYDMSIKPGEEDELRAAQAGVAAAKAEVTKLRRGPTKAELDAAQAEVNRAQAQLDLLLAGERPEAIAVAEADVAAAKAALQEATVSLAETELRAPFAGTVAALDVKVGEQVTSGAEIARIADLSSFQIETSDLTELGVVRVGANDPVTVTFDALPGVAVHGTVARIKPLGENKQGDIVYKVVVNPENPDPRLKWNMTASVAIDGTDEG